MKKKIRYFAAVILLAFGILTFFLSFSIMLDLFNMREKEGNYVPFVVFANFSCSLLYLTSAFRLFKSRRWTLFLLGLASIILLITFVMLKIYVSNGGIHEVKTIGAMIFRIILTITFALIAYFTLNQNHRSTSIKLP